MSAKRTKSNKSYYYIFLTNRHNLTESGGKVYKVNVVTDNWS